MKCMSRLHHTPFVCALYNLLPVQTTVAAWLHSGAAMLSLVHKSKLLSTPSQSILMNSVNSDVVAPADNDLKCPNSLQTMSPSLYIPVDVYYMFQW